MLLTYANIIYTLSNGSTRDAVFHYNNQQQITQLDVHKSLSFISMLQWLSSYDASVVASLCSGSAGFISTSMLQCLSSDDVSVIASLLF